MSILYTIPEIVKELNNKNITDATIRRWIRNGLKHLDGKPFLLKKEWVEEYIENENIIKQQNRKKTIKRKPVKKDNLINSKEYMKININDI